MSIDTSKSIHSPDQRYLVSLNRTELLNISLPRNHATRQASPAHSYAFGCDQEWFHDHWQRKAGCGPCTSATILYYLAQTKPACQQLYNLPQADGDSFCQFMDQIWHFVTPGLRGVNEASMLVTGVIRFARSHQLELQEHIFPVPGLANQRQPFADFCHFIRTGLQLDSPVAFLNLSNGLLTNLDSWHWVTITALLQNDADQLVGEVSDSGEKKYIDLALWYSTTRLGGAAVYFTTKATADAAAE